jgi:predicted DNA-binding ribbon-helix-helix protein
MRSVRRTISIPASLATRLDREAKRRGKSFSALIAEIAEGKPETLPYAGIVEDDPDLSLRVEEVLSRLAD